MEEQARHIAAWGKNVFVKIPVMSTNGAPTYDLIRCLSGDGIQLNVTALLTLEQVRSVCDVLQARPHTFPCLPAASPTRAAILCR